jgi:hypothetical protein
MWFGMSGLQGNGSDWGLDTVRDHEEGEPPLMTMELS